MEEVRGRREGRRKEKKRREEEQEIREMGKRLTHRWLFSAASWLLSWPCFCLARMEGIKGQKAETK